MGTSVHGQWVPITCQWGLADSEAGVTQTQNKAVFVVMRRISKT